MGHEGTKKKKKEKNPKIITLEKRARSDLQSNDCIYVMLPMLKPVYTFSDPRIGLK